MTPEEWVCKIKDVLCPSNTVAAQKNIRFETQDVPHNQVAHGHMLFMVHLKARPGLVRIATVAVALEI